MRASKKIVDLFNEYRQHIGAQQSEAAATLTLAHVLSECFLTTQEIAIANKKVTEEKDDRTAEKASS